ncbi:uncharacterized protein LOC101857047 [Aplysia californica]|uniref:Uncharacterized protein LOC101857047 n=1 Tax=Aplysia californica TaxID=6500 RepID=A0ABM0JZK9_APLCA|nr:uncharacterized protein LOC101857047 [Aplysia californica]
MFRFALLVVCILGLVHAYSRGRNVYYRTCYGGKYVNSLVSVENSRYADRLLGIKCGGNEAYRDCAWSSAGYGWGFSLHFLCPGNRVLFGMQTTIDSAKKRSYTFYCCDIKDKTPQNCNITPWINGCDEDLNWELPKGRVITGLHSLIVNEGGNSTTGDRRWRLQICDI